MMPKSKLHKKKLSGFTLNELLVVLIIIGILVLIALPSLLPLITSAKSTEAKLQLKHLYTLQQNHFYTYSRYADNLNELGFEQSQLVSNGGQANYKISISNASETGFIAIAKSVVDFDNDGQFNEWTINHKQDLKLGSKIDFSISQ